MKKLKLANISEQINSLGFSEVCWSEIRWRGVLLSALLMCVSVLLITFKGFNLGLEFTGGITYVIQLQAAETLQAMQESLSPIFEQLPQLVPDVSYQTWQLQFPLQDEQLQSVQQWLPSLQSNLGQSVDLVSSSMVGKQVGEQLFEQGSLALIGSAIAIMAYLSMRFEWRLALGAILALLHDVVIVLGLFVLFSIEFNLTALAALLAVIGYSLNDSIVIADRVRQNLKDKPAQATNISIDTAIRSTLFRTLVTSGTTLLTVSSIGLIAGGTLTGFAFALFSGIIVGSWSSLVIGTAIPEKLGLLPEHYLPSAPVLDEAGRTIGNL